MTYLKNLTSDLLGLHGTRKRLQAYSRLVNDCPPYLRETLNKIHDTFAWMDDAFEAKVLFWTYDSLLTFKEISAKTGYPVSYITAVHECAIYHFAEKFNELEVRAYFATEKE